MENLAPEKNVEANPESASALDGNKRGSSRLAVNSVLLIAVLAGLLTFQDSHARSVANAKLTQDTLKAAIPSVDVVHPSLGAASSEVVLPASVHGFIDSPVYERTSGYLLHRYADIGTHVKKGELLADSLEKIYAPFDGVITARNTDIGDLIQAGENTTPLESFHLSAIHRLRVFVPVPEVYQSVLKSGRTVSISSDAYPREHFTGTIARSSDAIDSLSRTLGVEVDIDNPKALLLPGAYVFVHFPLPADSEEKLWNAEISSSRLSPRP